MAHHRPSLLLITICGLATGMSSFAQYQRPVLPVEHRSSHPSTAQHSAVITVERKGEVDHAAPATHWNTKVVRREARDHGLPEVNAIKAAKLPAKLASRKEGASDPFLATKSVTPFIGTNFEANWSTQQTPPDNSMAVANNGWVVSANNDGVVYADGNGTIVHGAFWTDFFANPNYTANIYDPKILYDSGSDRFFMVILHGSTASTSLVIACFSKTNNPNDGWWVYDLSGNPLQNNTWFDYPLVGVTNNEVFVSGNLFTSGQNQFDQALIYQINKASGYNGQNLVFQYWYGLSATPYAAFTMVPVSYGHQGNYGPGVILVSTSAGGNNVVRLYEITDVLNNNPQFFEYTVNVAAYSPAADAQMPGSNELLSNGDCRAMGSFLLGDLVHLVFHADVGSGWNGIHYKRINITNFNVQQTTLGAPGVADISYPSMASFSSATTDPSVMLNFLASSTAVFPEIRVVNCDAGLQWSNATLVKAGETFVDFLTGGPERWGDYTGMARKHNAGVPEVWLAGCYAANVSGVLNNTWKTWIAQVGAGSVGIEAASRPAGNMQVYPVPAFDTFTLDLEFTEHALHTIAIHDMLGHLVKVLYQESPSPGRYVLTFNRGQLAAGNYILSVSTPNTRIAHENLVVQ